MIALVDIVCAAHVLDDVKALAERYHLGGMLHGISKLPQITAEVHHHSVGVTYLLVFEHRSLVLGKRLLDPSHRRDCLLAIANKKAKLELACVLGTVEREARRIGAAMLTAIQHIDQRFGGM